jgi:8-oxo-dGTP diphosphatase
VSNVGRHSVAVAAVVFDERGSVLLMKRRDHGNWEPPGGVLKTGESPPDAARRGALEETGVDNRVGPVTGVYTNIEEGVVTLAFRGEQAQRTSPHRMRPHPSDGSRYMRLQSFWVRSMDFG